MSLHDLVVQTERVVSRAISYRKYSLQIVQRAKRDELAGGVRRATGHRCARKDETWSNRSRSDRTNRRTRTTVVRRSQRVTSGQRRSASTRSKERVSASPTDQGRVTGSNECIDERSLRRGNVSERACDWVQTGDNRNSRRSVQSLGNL